MDPSEGAGHILKFSAGLLLIVVLIVTTLACMGWSSSRSESPQPSARQTMERRRLYFAAVTLSGMGIIFILAMAMNLWGGPAGSSVFEACKTGLPPIVTLILGYYFGKEPGSESPRDGGSAP